MTNLPTYTAQKPPNAESSEQLRARIPGWGVDLDPHDRPSVPKERFDPGATGAHWEFPERQPERWPRERSVEHAFLTPVFGTSCPPKGLSGVVRKFAYRRYSEGRAAHWLLLIAADRVDAWEAHAVSLLSPRPDNPISETGVRAEFGRNGIASRFGQKRADTVHPVLDPLIVGGPWLLACGLAWRAARSLRRRRLGTVEATGFANRPAGNHERLRYVGLRRHTESGGHSPPIGGHRSPPSLRRCSDGRAVASE